METTLQIGNRVRAERDIVTEFPGDPEKLFHSPAGGTGIVIALVLGFGPTIFWESTETVCDAEPGEDFTRIPDHTEGQQ